jgi:predicted TIM-barrel fold metal-dependent hydrolase
MQLCAGASADPSKAKTKNSFSRREFLATSALLAAAAAGCHSPLSLAGPEPIIDIHQHVGYSGRPDESLLVHQQAMGATKTILLPAGRPANTESTHHGFANGLQAQCYGNQACYRLARAHPKKYFFAANEVPDLSEAVPEIEKYLKRGGLMIAEQKFGLECDAAAMQRLYALAADYHVPILMHFQHGMYNLEFERLYKILEKFPRTTFIGHAQTWWANIDKDPAKPAELYPKGKVTQGGLTDRWLSDYPNLFGDLSANSGLNALTRDEEFTRGFLQRHQDKLMFGSDCNDWVGTIPQCQGAQTIAAVRRLAPSKAIERKLLYENARRMFLI